MGGVYDGKDLRKRYLLSLEWKRVGVMDNAGGDDGDTIFRGIATPDPTIFLEALLFQTPRYFWGIATPDP